jgi:hypothetical protein
MRPWVVLLSVGCRHPKPTACSALRRGLLARRVACPRADARSFEMLSRGRAQTIAVDPACITAPTSAVGNVRIIHAELTASDRWRRPSSIDADYPTPAFLTLLCLPQSHSG